MKNQNQLKMNTEQNTQDTLELQQEQNTGGENSNKENLNYEAYRHTPIEGTPFAVVESEGHPNRLVMGMWSIAEGGTVKQLIARAKRKDWDIIMGVMGAILQLEEKAKEYGVDLNKLKAN